MNKTVRIADLRDETPLPPFDQEFAPDPRASQRVAAAKRAHPQLDDDDAPLPMRHRPVAQQFVLGIVGVITVVGVLALALSQGGTPSALKTTPAAQAFDTASKTSPTTSPAPTPEATAAPRTIAAYAAPDGLLLGQIAAERAITPAAHYGSGWIAYQDGAGLVWVRASDRPDLALAGPDLAPAVAPPVPAVVPQTGRGMPNDSSSDVPPAAPAPVKPLVQPAPQTGASSCAQC